jgi:putative oxygen-independent coproporphyrinogen III oxidase
MLYQTGFNMTPVPALYLHIPFCRKVCPFCSFAVVKNNPSRHRDYIKTISDEYSLISREFQLDFSSLESVYLGGGTPSSLNADDLLLLMSWIDDTIKPPGAIHRSIEINPEDVDLVFCRALVQAGFTRVSLGVQSFDDANLKLLKRQHSGNDSYIALERIKTSGIQDLNIDLMFGYPGQSIESLQTDLNRVLEYQPTHISVYSLTIEPKTRWNRDPFWASWICDHEKEVAGMYRMVSEFLISAGFNHYEISNFCLPSYQSRQNEVYWHNRDYLGLGLGAHSHIHPYRWGNLRRMIDYQQALRQQTMPRDFIETIDAVKFRDEDLMLALRIKRGLDLEDFALIHKIQYSSNWEQKVSLYKEKGLLKETDSYLIPTVSGFLLSDEISASLSACL